MHNFKYHTVDELELLMEHLKNEIAVLKTYGDDIDNYRKQQLDMAEDMLTHAEFEVMERTLLK